LIGLSFITSLIFRHLNVQLKITRLYDNFIGNVTHELKSPLSSIQLYLETLKQRNVPPEKQKEFFEMMTKDANRLQSLINSILEVSAHEKGKLAYDYEVYYADTIIKNILEESFERLRVAKENYKIIGKADCEIRIGRDALKIVFDNLIDNSLKYSVKQPFIEVKIDCSHNNLMVEFADNGIGIVPKEQKKIFNKFYRIYSHDIPSVKGTGLGLYRVKELIKTHRGKITVNSEGEGKGTSFTLELPVYHGEKERLLKNILKAKNQALV
jgi:signal transduction histidine kinase